MLFKLQNTLNRKRFDTAAAGVLKVPPARVTGRGAHVISQLRHKDCLMYLLAIKSLAKRIDVAKVHVLDDGTLEPTDVHKLEEHVPGVEILRIREFQSPRCPTGGTWERLLAIAELSAASFVIQMDSDTVATGDLPEVSACVEASRAFTIGTWDNQGIETMAECSARAVRLIEGKASPHIQLLAEATFGKLNEHEHMHYVRGCSGFAGFPAGSVSREFLERFSDEMRHWIGDRWSDWGSEQLMSNVVIANTPGASVLPHPKYCNCNRISSETAFIHFVGNCRFKDGTYARYGRKLSEELSTG